MADWQDIEQLMQDLKRAQDSTTTQKLSERNCIEILLKLQEMKLLEVIHTMDGKEYITPSHLTQEIKDELYIHGGRVSLVDLQAILNVDYSHIETKANEIASSSNAIYLVLGQLIDKTYLDHLAEEINDTLQSLGQVRIADLCKMYDLPGEFLVAELVSRLGGIIEGRLDETNKDAIFTEAFIAQHKARVRGMLSALTRPTVLQPLLGECGVSPKLFYSLVDELIAEKRVCGDIVGKRSEKSTFLPEMYTRTQNQSVDNFYQQNGYLEYEMLSRLGIDDSKSYIRRRFKDTVSLKTVCVGPTILNLVSATIDETLASGGWTDMQGLLPSPFTNEDSEQLLNHVLNQRQGRRKEIGIVVGSVFASMDFQDKCKAIFEPILKEKAEIAAKDATVFALTEEEMALYSSHMVVAKKKVEEKEDDAEMVEEVTEGSKKKKERGGGGSGIGGREGKTKGKDKKRLKKQKEMEAAKEQEAMNKKAAAARKEPEFMDIDGLLEVLRKEWSDDCPESLLCLIAEKLHKPLNTAFKELSKSVFQLSASGQKKEVSGKKSEGLGKAKQSRKSFEEEINTLWSNIKLFNDAFTSFSEETAVLLRRHLLASVCTDLTNVLFNMVGSEYLTGVEQSSDITSDIRIKILTRLPEVYHTPLKTLHQTLNGKNVDDFREAFTDAVSPDVCSVLLKKFDKKRERQVLHGYKMALVQQLEKESDPATALHLCSAIIFQNLLGKMLHMPGKCVPHLILLLRSHVNADTYELLSNFQTLVIKSMAGNDNDNQAAIAAEMPKIKSLPATVKKS